ncbi:LysM domain/BON superfamily protein [Falsiruegeria litorea R37]|uniref:LysM domain/BON superfamily protein n=1 Tax=Falsiruegeria litorea R37 TaxID=1200284 RepID=A0A1Y5SQ15_9RHOB|nr:LysM peptidoglycan-binding domain-containing protein [Falsiruegeria litorea]SLN45764.1 LysM domain/BON superfamily protein [Falsiruegeria litorea R37]
MAASAGAGGLSAFGWVVVAGGVAVAGAAGLYFSGVLTPEPEVEQIAVAEPKPVPEPTKPAEPAQTEAEAPVAEQVADPEPSQPATETVEVKPEPQAAEPESEPVAESNEPQEEAAPATEETVKALPDVAPEPQAAPEPAAPALAAPALDTIRIEPDGSAVLAGKAAPGSTLSVRLDGQEIEHAQVDRSGAFALFLTLPFSDAPRGLSLVAELDGQTAQSDDYLLAALPKPRPVQVAEAEIQADPEPQQESAETTSETPQPDAVAEVTKQDTSAEVEAEPKAEEAQIANTQEAQPEQVTEAEPAVEDTAPQPIQDVEQAENTAEPSEETVEEAAQETTTPVATSEPTDEAEAEPETYETASGADETADETVDDAPRAVAILKSDEAGVELVQAPTSAEPAATAQIALDTIGYSDAGDVQLTGRATQGTLVRVYLDNLAVSDVITDTEGRWRGELDDVSPGIYTLRVDELGPGDVVLSRLETPFKREAPEVLAPKEPASGAAPETVAIRAVTVQKGDTLWAISRERYGDGVLYVKVFEANRDAIRNPDLIYPGQVFNIPE